MIIDTEKMNCANCKYWEETQCLAAPCASTHPPEEGAYKQNTGMHCEDASMYFAGLYTKPTHSCAEWELNIG